MSSLLVIVIIDEYKIFLDIVKGYDALRHFSVNVLQAQVIYYFSLLLFQDAARGIIDVILEYVLKNHRVNVELPTLVQAFQLSVVRTFFLCHSIFSSSI